MRFIDRPKCSIHMEDKRTWCCIPLHLRKMTMYLTPMYTSSAWLDPLYDRLEESMSRLGGLFVLGHNMRICCLCGIKWSLKSRNTVLMSQVPRLSTTFVITMPPPVTVVLGRISNMHRVLLIALWTKLRVEMTRRSCSNRGSSAHTSPLFPTKSHISIALQPAASTARDTLKGYDISFSFKR